MVDQSFWKGKRVFLTGHTGFKGSWISLWLVHLGAKVMGYSLEPPTYPSLFREAGLDSLVDSKIGNILDYKELSKSMINFEPDILIHMAAQPLVRYSYDEPIETYEVNVIGTVKVLEAARKCTNLKAILNITSDKCYENDDRSYAYKECDPMGGYDPYSSSKGCAELVTSAYRRSFLQDQNIGLASVRSGNVIGGGDWAKDRLVPDILRSFEIGESVDIRNPNSVRPWQHVLEPLSGYLMLAQKLYVDQLNFSEGWNFGPNDKDARPVEWIVKEMSRQWPGSRWKLNNTPQPHEASLLRLDYSKAEKRIGWTPVWSLSTTLEKIIIWHKSWLNNHNTRDLCFSEIESFMRDIEESKR